MQVRKVELSVEEQKQESILQIMQLMRGAMQKTGVCQITFNNHLYECNLHSGDIELITGPIRQTFDRKIIQVTDDPVIQNMQHIAKAIQFHAQMELLNRLITASDHTINQIILKHFPQGVKCEGIQDLSRLEKAMEALKAGTLYDVRASTSFSQTTHSKTLATTLSVTTIECLKDVEEVAPKASPKLTIER